MNSRDLKFKLTCFQYLWFFRFSSTATPMGSEFWGFIIFRTNFGLTFAQNETFMKKTTAWPSCTAFLWFCKIYMIFLIPFSLWKILKKIIRGDPVLQGSVNFAAKLGPEWPIFSELEFLRESNIIYLFYLEYSDYLILFNPLHLEKLKFLFHVKWKIYIDV